MKKIISLFAAVAMISTLFVSVVKADTFKPTVSTTVTKLTSAEYTEWTDETLAANRDAYIISVSLSKMGELSCTTKKVSGQTKHSGRKIFSVTYNMNFSGSDAEEAYLAYNLSNLFDAEEVTEGFEGTEFRSQPSASGAATAYPKVNGETIAANESIDDALMYMVVVDNTKPITVTLDAGMVVQSYNAGSTSGDPEVCNHAKSVVDYATESITFQAYVEEGELPGEAADDEGKIVAKEAGEVSGLTDLDGNAVTSLSKNYGIAKFTQTINTAAKDYYVFAKATSGDTNIALTDGGEFVDAAARTAAEKFKINFAIEGIAGNGTVSFYALVHSTTYVIDAIRLVAVDKAE